MSDASYDAWMDRALALAKQGQGRVEPNPMVGCVVVRDGEVVGEGCHERFGGPHAEVNALANAGEHARGATAVVTLEPCCHTGKTPPCAEALIAAGVSRVVIATLDPFPKVDGGGLSALDAAGIECIVGVREAEARRLLASYLKLTETGRPWVIAKWAMSLDGKIATHTGDSQWISGPESRALVHEVRGRMDAVIVGAGTLVADDPLLTARPVGPRTPLRVVIAGDRPLPLDRKLWKTPDGGPVLVAIGEGYPIDEAAALESCGVEVMQAEAGNLLDELGRRRLTNVLVEGGGKLLGRLFDERLVDEALAFIAPKIIGGAEAPGPIAGVGAGVLTEAISSRHTRIDRLGEDTVVRVRLT
ncbi:MAG: bifunctional diaminohydroxyphosphoribosylaminopyrimidine deaminase/5-amino-6-(5-phosphoribosylamino)uracil reductase RibD [Planctomycetota bacterium]